MKPDAKPPSVTAFVKTRTSEERGLPSPQVRRNPFFLRFQSPGPLRTKLSALLSIGATRPDKHSDEIADDYDEPVDRVGYDFGLSRRSFMQWLGAGLLIAAGPTPVLAQNRSRGSRPPQTILARIHLGQDGSITVLTGKVEAGQGAREELTQAAAEELRVDPAHVRLVMADTALVPDDGITAGSRSTPATVPAVRQGAAAARELLAAFASRKWSVEKSTVQIRDGKAIREHHPEILSYADFAKDEATARLLEQPISSDVTVISVGNWKTLGTSLPRPNGRDIVTGAHKYPSDITRPGMLYGKVLRPPAYGARLTSIDPGPAQAMKDVVVLRDESFVGVAAPTLFRAEQALDAIAKTAKWERAPHPSSSNLFEYLKQHARGGLPENPFAAGGAEPKKTLRASYQVAYAQHAPLEPRAAVADWVEGKLTVWTGTQNPFGCRGELMRAFHLPEENVRVIVPDFGAGFGGKHSGECGIEAARLAQAASRPVCLRWTREEEFTWAYFRPAAAIEIEAGLDRAGKIDTWHFININSGNAGLETPYHIEKNQSRYIESTPPLRHGSYRGLAATANHFARESFMDELAAAAGADPLEFRLAHLDNPRLRAVLQSAAERFDWKSRVKQKSPDVGVGLACGTEKGSYVAACAEIGIDPKTRKISVRRVCEVFECGPIMNPANLRLQVQGAIIMGLGPALREEVRFENGEMQTASFGQYPVPRFADVPEIDVHLLDRPDLSPAGAGETPIIAIAPAIANALFHATGVRVRSMPIQLPA
jgi:CO/xanthine dehydrogenase Mo-binding subunit